MNTQRMFLNIAFIFLQRCSIKRKQEIVRSDGEITGKRLRQKVQNEEQPAKKYVTDIYGELLSDMYDFELKLVITSKGFQASNLLIQRKIMSQDIAQQNNQPPYPPSDATGVLTEPNGVLPLESRIVEVTKQKKKIQVIEIHDSEEKEVKEVKPTKIAKIKERKVLQQPPKPKKMIIRCMLCKEAGKKATMKACLDCKLFTHISCLQQEGEQVLRYLCRKCKHKREENISIRKGEKGGDQKLTVRRLQKEKRKQEQQKKLGEFQERYPYYFQEDKVRFPIEDKLLFIYRELFDINETPKLKPVPHPIIPSQQLADFLQIQNFFSTFRQELVGFGTLPSEIKKNIFYLSMGSNGYDGIYCCLLQSLINIYLSDIFDKNKTDNVRILNDHPFFTLMTHLNDNHELNQQVLVKAAKEIMRYLGTIPSMKKAFQDLQYPDNIDLQSKTKTIVSLIKGLSQIDEFHDLVSIKSQKMQQLTKQKTELIAQLKIDEAENLSNNEKLKGMNLQSKELELFQEGVTRQLTKELDKHKKKMQKLATQQSKSQETIKQIRSKIAQIGRAMPFITSEMYYLGKDRNDSQYFFFMRQPNRIYVKIRSYLMDDNENFYMYEGKQTILQFVKGLNVKGIKQRHLCENIQSLLKDEVITKNILPEEESQLMLQEQKYTDITILDVLNMIKETQETFTTYLIVKEYQWASVPVRQMFMQQLMNITDLQILKENLRSLQQNFLFAQYINTYNIDTPIKRDDQSDDDIRVQAKEGRKKVPIRIWGINSEKTKKYWVEYLQECIDVIGIWICAYIFKNNVDKYVKKKMETYYEMQMKEKKLRKKQTYQRGRPPIKKQESEKSQKSENIELSQNSEVIQSRRPNLRARKQKKMNIDSEMENEPEQQEANEQSSNQDCCEICGEYGEMICCDTCPKVYHVECLKMKDIPEGQWSCVKCLQKLSNQRQTRSRVKKMGKFM